MALIMGLLTIANAIKVAKLPFDLVKEVFSFVAGFVVKGVQGLVALVLWCWKEVPQSIKDKINNFELLKVVILAAVAYFTSGGGVAGILKILEVFSVHVGDVYTDASNVAMVTGVIAMVAGYVNHKYVNGSKPVEE